MAGHVQQRTAELAETNEALHAENASLGSAEPLDNLRIAFVATDGHTIYIKGNAHCQFKHGKPVATLAILRDVTERLGLEER